LSLTQVVGYVFPPDLPQEELAAAKRTFRKPLHSHGLIEVTRRFLKRHYRDNEGMLHSGAVPIAPPVVVPTSFVEGVGQPAVEEEAIKAGAAEPVSAGSGSSIGGSGSSVGDEEEESYHRELEDHEIEDYKASELEEGVGSDSDEMTVTSIFGGNEEADRREPVRSFTGVAVAAGSSAAARRKAKWRARLKEKKAARKEKAVDELAAAAARLAAGGVGGGVGAGGSAASGGKAGGPLETVPEDAELKDILSGSKEEEGGCGLNEAPCYIEAEPRHVMN
jgi:hypothetical protein